MEGRKGSCTLFVLAIFSYIVLFSRSSNGGYVGSYKLDSLCDYSDGKGLVAYLKLLNDRYPSYGPPIQDLELTVRFERDDRLRVKITDRNEDRWEVPQWIVPRGGSQDSKLLTTLPARKVVRRQGEMKFASSAFKFSYTTEPFGFAVTRVATGEVLFNSTPNEAVSSMIFKDQYIEISTELPRQSALFGLGESTRPDGLRLCPGRLYTLWATDIGSMYTDISLYGTYPFYLEMRHGIAHGVLLFNSNGMDVQYGQNYLTYRVLGGVLDFYFFAGPTPLEVTDQYTQLVGRPAPMPYWTLGFHQSRYGYWTLAEVEDVVEKYAAAEIPLESMWSDIEYMDRYKDFTIDPVRYPEDRLRAFVQKLHDNHQKYVIIIDPGIAISEDYCTYKRGLDLDVYIRNLHGERYLGQVWPGPVHFPDFFHPNAEKFWTHEIVEFHKRIPFDGLWLDMNEAANFCTGPDCKIIPDVSCPGEDSTVCCLDCESSLPLSRWDDPPYKIHCEYKEMNGRTIAMSATHYGGVREYDAHNIFGLTESIFTYRALRTLAPEKRPFVLARSAFVGSGRYIAHWTGDNGAFWNDLAYSIVSCLNSGMFGVPMVGADICGFNEDTTEELCNRWVQVGAFYPFARDHADKSSINQELYLWESVAAVARRVLDLRYKLLPYYYTLIFEAHKTGAPIMRPLFFEFPWDEATLDIDTQFLVGRGILVSPVLSEGQVQVQAYFPPGVWYNAFDHSETVRVEGNGLAGEFRVLPAPLDTIQVHYRQGMVIPMQEAAMTTTLAKKTPFSLLVVFGDAVEDSATGELYLDDGEQLEMSVIKRKSTFVQFTAFKFNGRGSLQAAVTAGEYALSQNLYIEKITFLGLPDVSLRVHRNGNLAHPFGEVYSPGPRSVDVSRLHLSLGEGFSVSWDYFCEEVVLFS